MRHQPTAAAGPVAFRTTIYQVAPLLVAVTVLFLGHGLQGTLLGVRGGLEGMSAGSIGLVMSAYFLGFIVGSFWSVHLIETVGHIRTFAALASVTSAVALAYALEISVIWWLILRIINGFCFAGMILVVESWLNAGTESRWRGRVLAIYGTITLAAWAASQPMLSLADPGGFVLFCVISILVSLSLVPVTLSRTGVSNGIGADRLSARELFAISPIGLIGTFLIGIWGSAFWGMGPTFGQMIDMSTEEIAAFMAAVMIGAAIGQWPIGWLSDLMDRRIVLAGGTSVAATSAIGVFVAEAHNILFLCAVLYGATSITMYSICIAHVNDRLSQTKLLAAASGLLISYGAGSTFGPILAGGLMDLFGADALFIGSATVQAIFAIFVCWRIRVEAAVPKAEKEGFVAMPSAATSHVGVELNRHTSSRE
ncbi:MFS transporter [Salipiger thiooxidans]|uniref:MFS transporter n=1 Tax=Salipiger thiooxidans TaxID=282683 RepID=UPI001CD5E500|nr:MFS transporter [Salipiger thiooxidans]MCA0850930.1 MFS transporter [Salipiger thiooxidans]